MAGYELRYCDDAQEVVMLDHSPPPPPCMWDKRPCDRDPPGECFVTHVRWDGFEKIVRKCRRYKGLLAGL